MRVTLTRLIVMGALGSVVLAAALTVVGCGGSKGPHADLSVAADLATSDAMAPPDMTMGDFAMTTVGIACGTTPCIATAQYCCTDDDGATGSCGFGQATNCGAGVFYCDGPEDCPPVSPFCCAVGGTAVCGGSECGGTVETGFGLCHTAADCANNGGGPCCPSPMGKYALCIPTGC